MVGSLFTIAAPSGAGKTTLVEAVVASTPHVCVSVSHTTRSKRPGEHEGVNYFFVDAKKFDEMVSQDFFLEHATVFNYAYGTNRHWVEEQLAAGIDVILEIDWQGARQVKVQHPETVSIFILPPSLEALQHRLLARGQDDQTVIQTRMAKAHSEMSHYHEADYLVVNANFEDARQELQHILLAQRLRTAVQQVRHQELIRSLLTV